MTADLDYKMLPLGALRFDKDISGVINQSVAAPWHNSHKQVCSSCLHNHTSAREYTKSDI